MEQNRRTKLVNQPPAKPDYSHAIETAYRNYLFRSRLEAKYAVFFDLCGWAWSYEPMDMNGWIPDFAIGEWPTLVEVKPFFHTDQWDETVRKIVDSGCREPVLLLGADPTWNLEQRISGSDGPEVGEIIDDYTECDKAIRWNLHFGITEGNGKVGMCAVNGSWINAVWKLHGKAARVSINFRDCEEQLVKRWAKACNASRWMKVKNES